MIGEVSLFGVFVPSLGLVAIAAIILCACATRLLHATGFYRIVSYRPVVDAALFLLLFAAIARVSGLSGSLS